MATLAPATTRSPRSWARAIALQPLLVPLASLLIAVAVLGAGARLLIVVALPALAIGAVAHRLPRPARAAVALLLGVLALGAGLISRTDSLVVAGTFFLLAGVSYGWGVNRGRRRRRAWTNRLLAIVGAVLVGFFVVFPTLLAVDFLAKPRASINQAGLGIAARARRLPGCRRRSARRLVCAFSQRRRGRARARRRRGPPGNDPSRTDARERGLRCALVRRPRSRRKRGARERGRLAMGPGCPGRRLLPYGTRDQSRRRARLVYRREAVVTEAASDGRVEAVVADGLQARTAADASHASFGDRISFEPGFAVAGLEIRLARNESQPRPLIDVVHAVARTRPLLLIATIAFERKIDRVYTRGTKAQLWELPASAHTKGLQDHPMT